MTVESYTRLFVVGMAMLSALACSNGDGLDGGTSGWIVGAPAGDASSAGDAYATILYTDDGGHNWTRQGSYDTLPHTAVTSVVALDAAHAWAVSEHEVLSTDNGKTWTRHALPTAAAMETVYPVNNDVIWAVGFEATVLKSTDSGKSWSVSKVPNAQAQLQGLYALDEHTAWVAGGDPAGYLWRTIDGGTSWQLKYTGGPKLFETIRGVPECTTVDLAYCRLWAGAGARRIIRSDDGGETWELQTIPTTQFDDINGLSVVDRNTVYAAVDFGMMVTNNGGEDWVSRSTDPKATFMIGVEAIDSQTAWFVGPEQDGPDLVGRVAYTKTQGRTWESAPSLPVYPEFYAISFAK